VLSHVTLSNSRKGDHERLRNVVMENDGSDCMKLGVLLRLYKPPLGRNGYNGKEGVLFSFLSEGGPTVTNLSFYTILHNG